jgi:hypothetical protein
MDALKNVICTEFWSVEFAKDCAKVRTLRHFLTLALFLSDFGNDFWDGCGFSGGCVNECLTNLGRPRGARVLAEGPPL